MDPHAGAAGGALIGMVIGAAAPKWRIRYARPYDSETPSGLPGPGVQVVFSIEFP